MNIVLSIYTSKAYKEHILPNVNNTNYEILLSKRTYSTDCDHKLFFDIIEGKWKLHKSADYTIEYNKRTVSYVELASDQSIEVTFKNGQVFYISVSFAHSDLLNCQKFTIHSQKITIGSSRSNDIVYRASYISRVHASINYTNDTWVVEDTSQNGVFLNDRRVKVNAPLQYGDTVNIIGLKIVFLGNILAINCGDTELFKVNNENLRPVAQSQDEAPAGEGRKAPHSTKEYYNRAPRIMRELYTEPIEIEAPPPPRVENDKSVLATLGPSLTMALPMLLGCSLMIYSASRTGGRTNAYMFTGLVTAVSSAILGVFWGLINYRSNAKKEKKDEQRRYNAYSNYLLKMTEKIKKRNRHNLDVMNELYPSAKDCTTINSKSSKLWNRNETHDDFLSHRIGIGTVPFQSEIKIPTEKFSLIDDSLAEKPALIRETYQTLKNAPICLDLQSNRLIGIIGGANKTGAFDIMRNLSVQIGVNNCYTDVKLAYLFGSGANRTEMSYAKWLPHCWSDDKKTRFCAFEQDEVSDICYELTRIFRARDEASKESYGKHITPKPYYVIFVEDADLLEGEPLAKYIFDQKEEYGMTAILFAENYEDLPNSCECIVYNDGTYTGIYSPDTLHTIGKQVLFDHVDDKSAQRLARTLCKIEVSEVVSGGEIPNALSFLDMYHVDRIDELNVIERWKKNRTYENMRAIIGQKSGGTDCFLDIHEKYHGPHGLVAGTTGSGKSETLQTYILSLAVNFSPDDVGFLLVDFKGGGMANLFTDLPHTMGQISNLSGAQIRRAMVSIKSENLRRQRIFSESGVNNINAYTRLLKNNEATIPLPHLFIIIDEFAEMKREEPEFMSELISVAQVGRSLGVHLILATQKPGGVVDDNIRSNSKFKLCLRVQDKQDSTEMLGKSDAAYLSNAGRCYLQVGNDEIYELFQSGWSGAPYDETAGGGHQNIVQMISSAGKTTLSGKKAAQKFNESKRTSWLSGFISCLKAAAGDSGFKENQYPSDFKGKSLLAEHVITLAEQMEMDFPYSQYNEKAVINLIDLINTLKTDDAAALLQAAQSRNIILPEPKEKTQLDAVIDHLGSVFTQYGYHKVAPLWLPMLPEQLYLDGVGDFSKRKYQNKKWTKKTDFTLNAPIGICDDPENQAQYPLSVDFVENGHLAVCGNVTSGKSTFLQSMLFSLVSIYSPEELSIYAIDFSNHMLQCFESYPHTGAVLYETDNERIDKFFYMLDQMLTERKRKIGGGNFSQYVNAHGHELPAVVVAIDNYSNFREKTDDKYEKTLWEISRDGAAFGIYLAFSAGGFGSIEIQNKIGENIRNVIALDLGDKMKFSEVLRVMHLDIVPTVGVKGRGLASVNGVFLEFQTAMSFDAKDDYDRLDQLRQIGEQMSSAYKGVKARRIPEIPEKPTWAEISVNEEFVQALSSANMLPFAYVKETASIYSMDLRETYCYLIQGKSRTGRTDLLKLMSAAAKEKGADICVFEPGDNTLERFYKKLGAVYCQDAKSIFDYCKTFTSIFKERNKIKREMLDAGMEEDDVFERMAKERPIFIFVPNFAEFIKTIYTIGEDTGAMNGFFENIIEKGRLHNIYFVFDLNMDDAPSLMGRKVYNTVIGYKTGVQLGGLVGQRVFDSSSLPFNEQQKIYRPGTGFAFSSAGGIKVIIPSSRGI